MIDCLELLKLLCPLNRNIVSDGYDLAIDVIVDRFPVRVHEYLSGEKCWTWEIPPKWTCKNAYIESLSGLRVLDFEKNPLYVASYSSSIDAVVTKSELLKHIHTHQYLDDAPPFIFYYYQDEWAFCIEKNRICELVEEKYHVIVDSVKEKGKLKVAEYFLQGELDDCFVFSTHLDHPRQANDGLSGVVCGLALMDQLSKMTNRKYSYRLLIGPETIGSVAWLSHNEELIDKIFGGLFIEMTGLKLPPALQKSFYGDTEIDNVLSHLHLLQSEDAWVANYRELVGNDERQFNSPGVRIPMLSYARAHQWGHEEYPYREYHSSKDDVTIVDVESMEQSINTIHKIVSVLEKNYYPKNLFKGEIFLSGCGVAVDRNRNLNLHRNMLKIVDMIDGCCSVFEISQKLGMGFDDVALFLDKLYQRSLIDKVYDPIKYRKRRRQVL